MKKHLLALLMVISLWSAAQIPNAPTANDFSTHIPYTGTYGFGMNPGWYGFNWSTQQICDLGAGNPSKNVKGIGARAFRMQLYDNFLSTYGFTNLVPDYEHLKNDLKTTETAVMVGGPSDANVLDSSFFSYVDGAGNTVSPKSKVFKGLYEPVWLDAAKTQINPKNTYANYLYKTVQIYGQYVKYWEVWNEPDFTYGDGGWLADADPTSPNTWNYRVPSPQDLYNLQAPFYYYIRLLRISWEVIKTLQPNSYVCTGGIGNQSFLKNVLKYTDNPDGGKVTAEFPLTGGAYFDILSFHTYPEFSTLVKYWKNCPWSPTPTDCVGGTTYERHTDRLVDGHLLIKHWMDSLMRQDGYNGVTKPEKYFICTETGTSRDSVNGYGGILVQRNYMIKAHVRMMKDGTIKQNYWYSTADGPNPNEHWDLYGTYYNIANLYPYNATPTDQGIAQKTTSDLLFGKSYDAQKTASLNLPTTVDGGAFKDAAGKYVYVLWAKTTKDLSEVASATITLPVAETFTKKDWDYSKTGKTTTVSNVNLQLSATPFFLEPQATIVLPVKLISFNGALSGKSVKLTWTVAEETNVARYEVERSADGINFTKIGTVTAANLTIYTYVDQNALKGTNYYRLKMVDQDTKFTYSNIITVRAVNGGHGVKNVKTFDVQGRLLESTTTMDLQQYKNNLKKNQVYILQITDSGGTYVEKVGLQ